MTCESCGEDRELFQKDMCKECLRPSLLRSQALINVYRRLDDLMYQKRIKPAS